jgi:hypothetical protein
LPMLPSPSWLVCTVGANRAVSGSLGLRTSSRLPSQIGIVALEELLAEADKLRRALAVLDPRKRSRLDAKTAKPRPAAKARPAPLVAAEHAPARTRTRTRATDAKDSVGASTRTAPGETKAKVLAALSGDQALTAG